MVLSKTKLQVNRNSLNFSKILLFIYIVLIISCKTVNCQFNINTSTKIEYCCFEEEYSLSYFPSDSIFQQTTALVEHLTEIGTNSKITPKFAVHSIRITFYLDDNYCEFWIYEDSDDKIYYAYEGNSYSISEISLEYSLRHLFKQLGFAI